MSLRLKTKLLVCFLALIFTYSCNQDKYYEEKIVVDRTIFVYMSGENSLASFCAKNIEAMKEGLNSNTSGLNLIVYEDKSTYSYLWQLYKDKDGNVVQNMIESYNRRNSADKDVMTEMINIVFNKFPAKEKGLILWSHGTGWLPSTNYKVTGDGTLIKSNEYTQLTESSSSVNRPAQYSFGEDSYHSSYMEIWDLKTALKNTGLYFDFIAFDACHMTSVEVAYELKDFTSDIMGSAAEIMGDGYPYTEMTKIWQKKNFTVGDMCAAYAEAYKTIGGTIAWIKTSQLENIATFYSELLSRFPEELDSELASSIQQYGRSRLGLGDIFYDMNDVVRQIFHEDYSEFYPMINCLVPYRKSTETFLGFSIDLNVYTGITVFIPEFKQDIRYHDAYKKLDWYNKVYLKQ